MKFSDEEKAMWLEDWRKGGKNAWTYAKENGLIPQTFCRWVKHEAKRASGFIELPRRIKPKQEQAQELLIEKGDIKIHVPLSVWVQRSREIMEGLRVTL